jgi:DNA methyltransferase 1-associated protein 1
MSSDILEVLNLDQREQQQKKRQKLDAQAQPQKAKPLTGINRELYELLGQNTPPVPVRNQQKFKDRLNALARPSPWSRVSFKNGARNDGLKLQHWVKGTKEAIEAADVPYKFEKYNSKLNIPSFTEEDYDLFIADDYKVDADGDIAVDEGSETAALPEEVTTAVDENKPDGEAETATDEDKKDTTQAAEAESSENAEGQETVTSDPWDYKETQYLFELSSAFDLKWVVIHDRYEYEERNRTLEELQDRFYSVCQRILIHENEVDESSQNSNLISNLNFNRNKEVKRKTYLNRLLDRSPAEIAEEESLLIEAKKFEVAAKKTISERAGLLQLLDSPQASGSISQYLTSQGLTQLYNSLMTEKRKRRVDSPAPENPLTALNEKIKQQQLLKQKQQQREKLEQQKKRKENPIYALLSKNLSPQEEEAFGLKVHSEKISLGVTLRSSKVTSYKQGVQTKIAGVLNELGLGRKPVITTEKVVKKQEELLKTINTMLDLKRQLDKLDAESRILK